jgi:hypothetical protein
MSFVRYNTEDSVISSETVVRGAWSSDAATLNSFYTSSNSTANNSYYINVYDNASTSSVQFSIQYGHADGSGSTYLNSSVVGNSPTRITYGQYRSLIYNDENSSFNFGGYTSKQFFALPIARSRFKESIKPGSLSLKISGSTGIIQLTDSSVISGSLVSFIGSNRYYTLMSGSQGTAYTKASAMSSSYGMLFPDLGLIILNADALSSNTVNGGVGLSLNTTANTAGNPNIETLFKAISGSYATAGHPGTASLQSQETVSSRYFFTRVKNNEFNYTTNPSIINDSGSLLYDTLIDNPQTYVTTVGMYNDNNELLAVAKLSRPLIKDFTKESLIRIKLDY